MMQNDSNRVLRLEITTLRLVVISLLLLLILMAIMTNPQKSVNTVDNTCQIDSLLRANDSLRYEVFIEHTNAERYEIALDRLREEDSLSAKKFEDKLSNIE